MAVDHTPTLVDDERNAMAVKAIYEQTAMLSNLAYSNLIANSNLAQQNAVSQQQALNQIQLAVTGKVVNLVASLGPVEAVSSATTDTGKQPVELPSDLKAPLSALAPSPPSESERTLAGQPVDQRDSEVLTSDMSAPDPGIEAVLSRERSAILANLELAHTIFNASIAQQNVILRQQVMFQLELAALAKCIQALLSAEGSDPDALEQLTARLIELLDLFHSKPEEL